MFMMAQNCMGIDFISFPETHTVCLKKRAWQLWKLI
jgi:hypothetical protein